MYERSVMRKKSPRNSGRYSPRAALVAVGLKVNSLKLPRRGILTQLYRRPLLLDVDMTGVPCGPNQEGSRKGYFGENNIRYGRQRCWTLSLFWAKVGKVE